MVSFNVFSWKFPWISTCQRHPTNMRKVWFYMRNVLHKLSRKDYLFLGGVIVFILLIIGILTRGQYVYGSKVDWVNQHSVLPDYFRQHFYETKKLMPDFAFDLGAGQNIYNFAYYGFLNPITLISYFLPWVSMGTYVMVSSIVLVFLSIILFFLWLKMIQATDIPGNIPVNDTIIYVTTFLFACASPLLFHSHKQIMYMDYMPFMLLCLIGTERFFAYRKKGLLIINVALMFLTSYFFAVPAVVALLIYAIYKYLAIEQTFRFKTFWQTGWRYSLCLVTGILLSCLIILPSFVAILSGRNDKAGSTVNLLSYFIPNFPTKELLYSSYGVGMTAIALIALLAFIFIGKDKARIFLAASLLIVICFPISRYILNGCLYTRGKALIPFLPIVALIVAFFLEETVTYRFAIKRLLYISPILLILLWIQTIVQKTYGLGALTTLDLGITMFAIYLSRKHKKPIYLYCPILIIAIITLVSSNIYDSLLKINYYQEIHSKDKSTVLNEVLSQDSDIYRSNDLCETKSTNNMTYSSHFAGTGFYSSLFNRNYVQFCNYDVNLANPTVNDISITTSKDVLFQTFMGVRYTVSDFGSSAGYVPVKSKGNYTVYKNENSYSLGFTSKQYMSKREFFKLKPADRQIALLQYIVVDKDLPDVYESKLEPVSMKIKLPFQKNGKYNHVKIKNRKPKKYTFTTPDDLKDYVYIITCHLKAYSEERSTIRINGIQNSLSGLTAAYPNKNFDFKFVVSSNTSLHKLTIDFPESGEFDFTDFEISRIKYSDITALSNNITPMTDIQHSTDNTLSGKIHMEKDGYFTTTIPYDDNFTAYVDGKETPLEKTDTAFTGLKLSAGTHEISFVYQPPAAKEGKILSLFGLLLFLGILIVQHKKNGALH